MTQLKEGLIGGGLNLYFIYKFLRILTTPWEKSEAFKLGIVDDNGKILKKKRTLKTVEEKEAYTIMHRLVWKLKRLMEKVPFGKSRLASYAAALWLIKEHKFQGTDEQLQESFLSFLETDWKNDALILKENHEGDMDKKTFYRFKEEYTIKEEVELDEYIQVENEKSVGKFKIIVMRDGNTFKTAVMDAKKIDKYNRNDQKDLKTLWDLAVKYKGKEIKEEVELDEKWAVGVVYHQEFKNGDRAYFRADVLQKNTRWKGMQVDEFGGKQKKPKNATADEKTQGWETTPEKEIPKGLKEEVEIDERDEWKNTRIQAKNIFKMLKQKHKNDIPKMKSGLELILKQNKTKPDQEKIMWQEFNKYFKIKEEVEEGWGTSKPFAGWIAIYKGQRLEIKKSEAKGLWPAKQLALKHFKVPKSKEGLLAIAPAIDEMNEVLKSKDKSVIDAFYRKDSFRYDYSYLRYLHSLS